MERGLGAGPRRMDRHYAGRVTAGRSYCPLHGNPDRPGYEWPCPVAVEGDPEDAETCPHLVAEMERRSANVAAGNFWRMERDQDGFVLLEFKAHQPTGVTRRFPRGSEA